jgi:hexosaminidase
MYVMRWAAFALSVRVRSLAAVSVGACVLQACSGNEVTSVSLVKGSDVSPSSPPAAAVKWPPAILPIPRVMQRATGAMTLPPTVTIQTRGKAAHKVALQLESEFERLGINSSVDGPETTPPTIRLTDNGKQPRLGAEGYELHVGDSGIDIVANTDTGLYYGAQTLDQLATTDGRTAARIPYVRIIDWPEYRWRGLHLDVSRHFFPKRVIESYIDIASRFKLNTFHWHLTDDQGWRLDVPKYPLLTKIGGCRDATQTGGFGSTTTDEKPTCSYYSESDVRDIVAFATDRHVAVIPEIEGPGHSVEAMAAYGFLACAPGPYATLTLWGSTKYSLCPTEKTFAFYDDIFRELAELFPAPYVHIGGDEVPYYSWRGSPAVALLMRRQGLTTYADVQGYFTRRVQKIAKKHHRSIVGWDEIDKAGVSPGAIVMAWNGSAAGLTASRHGNDVVMTPDPPLYFDAYQGPLESEPAAIGGLTTLEDVYKYDPFESIDAPELRKHFLGAQGNTWTEYIPNSAQLWYMVYPRALALSELCWSARARMHWDDFKRRAGISLARLEPLGVTFRIPEVTFRVVSPNVTVASGRLNAYRAEVPEKSRDVTVRLDEVVPNAAIYYTLNGGVRDESLKLYKRPLHVKAREELAAVAVIDRYRRSDPASLTVSARR